MPLAVHWQTNDAALRFPRWRRRMTMVGSPVGKPTTGHCRREACSMAKSSEGSVKGELRLASVTVRFGRGRRAAQAVRGVDLTVPPGVIVGLVGESGSGKSTLARAIVGLLPVTAGEITYEGVPIARSFRPGVVRPIQMVFQDPY